MARLALTRSIRLAIALIVFGRSSCLCRGVGIRLMMLALLGSCTLGGCHRGPVVVPVRGTVTLDGNPLAFGTITFQPSSGQPSKGTIESNGNFSLSTFVVGDGAVVGIHKVRVTSYSSQDPNASKPNTAGEQSLGKLLIPQRYTLLDQSGLKAEVTAAGPNDFKFELQSK